MNWIQWVRPNIIKLTPYSSARSEFKGQASVFLDANENPYPLPYARYPDPLQKELKNRISNWRKIKESHIFLGNGSDEIIDLLIRVFCIPGLDTIYTFTPGFGMYKVAADINNVEVVTFPLSQTFSLDIDQFIERKPENCKIIFLCSPNNPTGSSLSHDQIRAICKKSHAMVVVDEAYIDFSEIGTSLPLLATEKNLVILQTFSKAMGAAGLRLGMGFAQEELVDILNKVKMPYNISKINQEEAIRVMERVPYYTPFIDEIKSERARLMEKLAELSFVKKVYPSDGNFLLIKVEDANDLYDALKNKGIIVRNRSSLPGCDNCLRITIGVPDENECLLNAMQSYTNTNNQ